MLQMSEDVQAKVVPVVSVVLSVFATDSLTSAFGIADLLHLVSRSLQEPATLQNYNHTITITQLHNYNYTITNTKLQLQNYNCKITIAITKLQLQNC